MCKKILYQDHARQALEKGMQILVEAVSVTLGPKGRNVVLDKKYGSPQIINDGVSIAKEIELSDNIFNTGVSLIRQAASKTNDVAGDGTTTATVLAYAIVKKGMKNVAAGSNPISLKVGLEKGTKYLINQILEYSRPIEDNKSIMQVATISSGNDKEIGKMIAEALNIVGRDGIISLEESNNTFTELNITEGMRLDKGFISPYFITDPEKAEVQYEKPFILITNKRLTLVQQDLIPVLEKVAITKRPLLIIAEDIEKEALSTLVLNKLRGIIPVVAIRAPGFGDFRQALLEDIAILTRGTLITEDLGLKLENIELTLLGEASKIIVAKDSTVIITNDNTENIRNRCEQLKKQIIISESSYDTEKLKDRVAKLSGGIAIIKVGAVTETEMKDKKLRLEDAINATRAAVEEGIIPGGGATLTHFSTQLKLWAKQNLKEDQLIGAYILAEAIIEPLKKIAENTGKNGSVIVEMLGDQNFEFGYNAEINEFGNMFDYGIVDPAKVTRSALQNAVSIASMILTTECIVVTENKVE
uniref:Chaperonin GroEL, chloroplastic n=1 Tax=Dictyopteris divaricata TaxID=156996 RepID=A0A2I4Q2B6_9PHAE|nr:60 kDa chaperonin [Dictyopteris divaricata]YP_010205280.1 60 kDa chaperonin [Grateloupia livida]AQZ24991.1 60 kDa chaperonin [Dictyopteris divaricata]UAV85849.1 60 kDa chaperonin [Grateloupia livida]